MSVIKKLAVALVLLALAIAAAGLLLPRNVHVERAITIDRPPATVFTVLNSYRSFNQWSPWFDLDPQAAYSYEGPTSGVGAKVRWSGDPDTLGSGSQEIIEARPYDRIGMALDFGPEGAARAAFTLAPQPTGTRVTWAFDTDLGMNPANRYLGLFFDRWMGQDFDKGLARLKTLVEALPPADFSGLEVDLVDVAPVTLAYVSTTASKDVAGIAKVLGESYAEISKFITARKLEVAGAPVAITTRVEDTGYAIDAGIPVKVAPADPVPAGSRVQVTPSYGGRVAKVVHRGPYAGLGATHDKLLAWLAAHGHTQGAPSWNEFVSDPGQTAEPDLVTNVFVPIK